MWYKERDSIYPAIGSVVTDSGNNGLDSLDNKNLLSSHKKNILIIEDSEAVSLVIHRFLKNLGYENIFTCTTGRNGIKIFTELTKLSRTPIVFLSYSLPDMTGHKVLEGITDISQDAKIIASANEKTDEATKEILKHSTYEFLEKPIRFENIKNIMKVLETDDNIMEDVKYCSFDKMWSK